MPSGKGGDLPGKAVRLFSGESLTDWMAFLRFHFYVSILILYVIQLLKEYHSLSWDMIVSLTAICVKDDFFCFLALFPEISIGLSCKFYVNFNFPGCKFTDAVIQCKPKRKSNFRHRNSFHIRKKPSWKRELPQNRPGSGTDGGGNQLGNETDKRERMNQRT